MSTNLFVQITPGLEDALADELLELGLRGVVAPGGITLRGDLEVLHALHVHSRLAARVLVRVLRSRATSLEQLATVVRQAPWGRWVHPRQPLDVRVSSHSSRLRHRETVAKKVEHAVADALRGPRVSLGRPPRAPARILVRVEDDEVEASIDASGDLLHRRGWRLATAKAPLRENLAAAVLRLAGWQPGEPLVDPMCGSGTFAIEAATIAMGIPPGVRRSFAFEHWPGHDAKAWASAQAQRSPPLDRMAPILGADRDAGAVEASRGNAGRARVADRIRWSRVPVAELEPPARAGLVVANPPYGKRVDDAARVYGELGRAFRARWSGWRLALLVPDRRLLGPLGVRMEEVTRFSNGGIPVTLMVDAGAAPS